MPLFALLVIVVLVLPYLIWLIRADTLALPPWPGIAYLRGRALHWVALLGGLVLAISGVALLTFLNSGWFARNAEDAPIIYRPPVDRLARDYVYFLPWSGAGRQPDRRPVHLDRVAAGAGIALMMSGLAVIVASGDLIKLRQQRVLRRSGRPPRCARACWLPRRRFSCPGPAATRWRRRCRPTEIARFFGDSFERRTNQRLRAVTGKLATGDPDIAGCRAAASVSRYGA